MTCGRVLWMAALLISALATPAYAQLPKGAGSGMRLIERLNQMNPEQRRKMLDKMSPERRKALENRIDHLAQITPEAREKLNKDYERFQQLPPERQAAVRQTMKQITELPDERRPLVRGAINSLRKQTAEVQGRRMASRVFQERFSDDERKLIKDALGVLPPSEIPVQQ